MLKPLLLRRLFATALTVTETVNSREQAASSSQSVTHRYYLRYAEFGRFADEFGNDFSVEKLREFEVDRADEADDEVDQEKRLKEYAEYLGESQVSSASAPT